MGTWSISPKFTNAKLDGASIEGKIDVFEDQIEGWVLHHAKALCSEQYNFRDHAGFAILTIVCPYFEAIESYCLGLESSNQSKRFFRQGFMRVFPRLNSLLAEKGYQSPQPLARKIADTIYDQLRCGLLHEASAKNKIVIRKDVVPLSLVLEVNTGEVGSVIIDPCLFLNAVEAHFLIYVAQLRDPLESTLRENFERFFDTRFGRTGAVLPPP